MEIDLLKHEHATSSWVTIEMTPDSIRKVLVVETKLPLYEESKGFDEGKLAKLEEAITAFFEENPSIKQARIVRIVDAA